MKTPQTLGHIISALVGSQVQLGEDGATVTCKRGQESRLTFKTPFLLNVP